MASTDASAAPGGGDRRDREVPLWRLYLMRAMCLLFISGALFKTVPHLIDHAPAERGMLTAILCGLWVMAFLALRYPLQMIPIFLFEIAWKTIWLVFYGLPQWLSGIGSPSLGRDMFEIGLFPFVIALVIPWGYVWRHYVREPAERWR
jgi:hypothetical protein